MKKIRTFIKTNFSEITFLFLFLILPFIFLFPYVTVFGENDASVTLYLQEILKGNDVVIGSMEYQLLNPCILFYVAIFIFIISAILIFILLIVKEKINNKFKIGIYSISTICIVVATFILSLGGLFVPILSSMPIGDANTGITNVGFGAYLLCIASLMCILNLGKIFETNKYTIKEMSETAILVALAIVLDKFAKIPIQANGGSISLSAVPLFIIAIRYGGFKGFIASSVYFGFITCLIDGYGIQTFPFDYFIALSGYGIVGTIFNLFKKFYIKEDDSTDSKKEVVFSIISLLVSGIIVMVVRYIGHVISGLIMYPTLSLLDNFIYQSTYVPASVWVSIGAMIVLIVPIIKINKIYPPRNNG